MTVNVALDGDCLWRTACGYGAVKLGSEENKATSNGQEVNPFL